MEAGVGPVSCQGPRAPCWKKAPPKVAWADSRGHLVLPPPPPLPPYLTEGRHHLGLRELAFPGNLEVGDSGESWRQVYSLNLQIVWKVT